MCGCSFLVCVSLRLCVCVRVHDVFVDVRLWLCLCVRPVFVCMNSMGVLLR